MNKLVEYTNGNTHVIILKDGTKTRTVYGEVAQPHHPESIDVKITNYCDMGCLYCHEMSTRKGEHGNLYKLLEILDYLPRGIELAIGGGNPLSHPYLLPFLQELKFRGFIPNITVNQGHVKKYRGLIDRLVSQELVYGVGISVTNIKNLEILRDISKNIVYHLILGINNVTDIDALYSVTPSANILLLGYKQFGYGVNFYSDEVAKNILTWQKNIRSILLRGTISFDNLALEQLKLRDILIRELWENLYMGNDGEFTMYIDAVEQTYAKTSRSSDRVSFNQCDLLTYFKELTNATT